jgi:plastocyanin
MKTCLVPIKTKRLGIADPHEAEIAAGPETAPAIFRCRSILDPRMYLPRLALGLLLALAYGDCMASAVQVKVRDMHGLPVADAVVSLLPLDRPAPPSPVRSATMDQRHLSFVPQVLVVQAGTNVRFPNSDNVRHHVYSFSPAKRFELKLYAGNHTSSVLFDKPGVVVLGCNIHDWMLGYIVVVDTPWFAKTGTNGIATVEAPAGRYMLKLWHPRQDEDTPPVSEPVTLGNETVLQQYVLKLHPAEITNTPPPNLEIGLGDRVQPHAH